MPSLEQFSGKEIPTIYLYIVTLIDLHFPYLAL